MTTKQPDRGGIAGTLTAVSRPGLSRTLLVSFMLMALVPLTLVSTIGYLQAKDSLRDAIVEAQQTTIALKTAFIDNWFEYRFLDLEAQSTNHENIRFLKKLREAFKASGKEVGDFVGSDEWTSIIEELGADLKLFRTTYGYYDVFLIDSDGNILCTAIGGPSLGTNLFTGLYSDTLFARACRQALESGRPTFSDFEFYAPSNNEVAGFLASPIVDEEGEKTGLIAFQIPIDKIDAIMQDRTGLGKTGETFLVGADLAFRSDSALHEEDRILSSTVDTEQTQKWYRKHIAGDIGKEREVAFIYSGHHGRRVLGTHTLVEVAGIRWALIIEIEEAEAFAQIARQRTVMLGLWSVTGLVALLAALMLSQRIVRPVLALTTTAERIRSGDRDVRAAATSKNEIGILAQTFNSMLDALHESEAKTRQIVDTAADGIVTMDEHSTVLSFNPAAETIFGYTAQEVMGRNMKMLMPGSYQGGHDAAVDRYLTTGETTIIGKPRVDVMGLRKDGEEFPLQISVGEVVLEKGRMFTGVLQDVSVSRQAEEELQESEARYREIFENTTDLVQNVAPDGSIKFVNQAWLDTLGYSEDEITGLNIFDVIHPDNLDHCKAVFGQVMSGATVGHIEATFNTKDGNTVYLEGSASCSFEDGKPVSTRALFHNITERKRNEEALKAARDDLERKVEERTAELLSRETRLRIQNDALHEIGEMRHSALADVKSVFKTLTQVASHTLGVERVSIWKLEEGNTVLRCQVLYEAGKSLHSRADDLLEKDFPGYFKNVRDEQIIDADDALTDDRTKEFSDSYLKPLGVTSMLDVSIGVGESHYGVVCAEHIGPKREWSLDEQSFVAALANMASLALEIRRSGEAEKLAHTSAEELTQLIDTANAPIFGVDTEGKVNEWNEKIVEITGYGKDEAMGRPLVQDFITKEYRDSVADVLGKALRGEETSNYEVPLFTKEGERVMILLNSTTRRDADGAVVGVVGIGQDITELDVYRTQMEGLVESRTEELQESLEQVEDTNIRLEEVNRHKSKFLSSMSHELRTPLNAILGFSDLLNGQGFGPLNKKQARYVEQIDKSGEHLLSLINDLLDMAKIDAGAMTVELESFPVSDCIDSIVTMMSPQFRKKRLEHKVYVDPSLPMLHADRRKVNQILLNLLSNAVKYTPEEGTISVRAERGESNFVRISVSDTGVGVKPEHMEDIFSEFKQADRERDEELGGIGLGLALVRRLLELHGGEIGVESEPGSGSTFWFTLPCKEQDVSAVSETDDAEMLRQTGRGLRILVAEDNEANLDMVLDMLTLRDHKVAVARNGQEAIDLAQSFKPDLILMDIRMPVMNGLEATQKLRAMEEFAHTPIIALTASAGPDSKEKCLAAGCTAHLAKPVKSDRLYEAIYNNLRERVAE